MFLLPFVSCLCSLAAVDASVTVYGQVPLGALSASAAAATASSAAEAFFDNLVLTPPAIPSPPIPTQFPIQLQGSSSSITGLSIPQSGTFFGFSIEMSVVNQVLGINASHIQVPFLNLMANLEQRAGQINIRVGGNTQETASHVDSLPNNAMIAKDTSNVSNPTQTPALLYTTEMIYLLSNISSLVNAKWYLGVPLNDSANLRLQIAEISQSILGSNLLGLQVGNEPDLYAAHGHRPQTYSPFDYFGEFGDVVTAMKADPKINSAGTLNLIGPSVSVTWTPEMVWDTNFIPTYTADLSALSVEHYPDDNCAAQFGLGAPVNPQDVFPSYLTHTSGQTIVQPYINSAFVAQAAGKPLLMFETNTASCGGFPGISDSFGAALWALDYGLTMAYSNFSGALLHVGGVSVYYNPFTAPPTNESAFHQWTIGPVYYSALIVAEIFGSTKTAQIIDLFANGANQFTPAYAIYDGGVPTKVALFNYITDPSGASNYNTAISINGATMPSSVQVKYLVAPSVSEKINMTWAGQTLSGVFQSDGRMRGTLDIRTINCDQNANTCTIPVPAPGFALVYLKNDAFDAPSNHPTTETFSTTAYTKTHNTATIDPSALATSNGHSGSTLQLGSTSKGNLKIPNSSRPLREVVPSIVVLSSLVLGALVVGRALTR